MPCPPTEFRRGARIQSAREQYNRSRGAPPADERGARDEAERLPASQVVLVRRPCEVVRLPVAVLAWQLPRRRERYGLRPPCHGDARCARARARAPRDPAPPPRMEARPWSRARAPSARANGPAAGLGCLRTHLLHFCLRSRGPRPSRARVRALACACTCAFVNAAQAASRGRRPQRRRVRARVCSAQVGAPLGTRADPWPGSTPARAGRDFHTCVRVVCARARMLLTCSLSRAPLLSPRARHCRKVLSN